MNHDYAHCLDYTKDCPKECFRVQLQRDIEENRSEFVGVPLTYSHLGGTDECKLAKDKDVTRKMSLELSCNGCKNFGKWENEVEYGYSSPCTYCKRRAKDNYER